jgi:AcrR family transcriptional regulator
MHTGTARPVPGARRDAVRNRERILGAARHVVAREGEDADVREIARVAGLGMGTLYRHFATKRALLDAALAPEVDNWAEEARAAAGRHDAWTDLRRFLVDALTRQATHRGLAQRYASPAETPTEYDACRRVLQPVITDLVSRARAEGSLRADVTAEDIALLLIGLARITEVSTDPAPDAWRRQLDLVLDGLRAPAITTPGTDPAAGSGSHAHAR